ncbi:MAG: Spx/MgsR family RNA polymerase-binding regulatory protein [Pseudomonadota bacterium]
MITYYGYKNCGTSKKGEKFLIQHNLDYEFIDITLNPPSREKLQQIISQSGKPINKFFNTSGVLYREMQLKNTIKTLTDEAMINLLSQHGKLIKRPLLSDGTKSSVAFNEQEFTEIWL